jgi:hypothetical protein
LEKLLATEVLEVRVLHPAIAQSLVGKVISVLEDRQARHQPRWVLDLGVFDAGIIAATDAKEHPNVGNLKLIVIRGAALMNLVHALYKRAASEA